MYSHACFLPSAQHRNVFQGVLSRRVQYLMRAIRTLSSSAFMTAATACSTLCGSQISLIPFRTLALPWNGPEMAVSNGRRGHESSFFGGGLMENRWGRVRGELHGRLKRSPPSRRFRCRRGLIIGAPQCIESTDIRECLRGHPRHVARGSGLVPCSFPKVGPENLIFIAVESPKSPVFTRGLLSAGRRRFQDMSPFDTIAKAVYRRPLTVYLLSILVPVALTLALVRARGKTHRRHGTPFLRA